MWFKHSPTKQAGLEPIRGCTRQYETRIRMIDSRNIAGFCKKIQETTTGTRIDSGTALLAWEEMPIQWWQLAKILVSMFGNVILKPAATNITAWTRGTSEFPSSCKSLNLMPCLRCCRFGRCREVKRLSLPSIQDYRWHPAGSRPYQKTIKEEIRIPGGLGHDSATSVQQRAECRYQTNPEDDFTLLWCRRDTLEKSSSKDWA